MEQQGILDSKALNALLPKETAEQYKVVNYKSTSSKIVTAKFGEIDFKTLSPKRAQVLIDKGATFLAVKQQKGKNVADDQS